VTDELTEEERDFLRQHQGGLFDILGPTLGETDHSPKAEAARGITATLAIVTERYESRTERLLVLAELTRQARAARDELLRQVIESFFDWHQDANGEWWSMGVHNYDKRHLASLAGVSEATITRLVKKVIAEEYEAHTAQETTS
jgi:hypothetical protein